MDNGVRILEDVRRLSGEGEFKSETIRVRRCPGRFFGRPALRFQGQW